MRTNRIVSGLAGIILSYLVIGSAAAKEDGWLAREKHASPSGQWILREDGTTFLKPAHNPTGTYLPPGFDEGKKVGFERGRGHEKGQRGRPGLGHLDRRVYGDGTRRKPPGFIDTRTYGGGAPRKPPGFVDTRTYGGGAPRLNRPVGHDRGKHKGLEQGRRVGPPDAKPIGGRKVGPREKSE